MPRIVTIDGPAGVGKSTASRGLARRLCWLHLDSGSLYRAVAWNVARLALDPGRPEDRWRAAEDLASTLSLTPDASGGTSLVIAGLIPGPGLRTEEVGRDASIVARDQAVRDLLLPVQRGCARSDLVAEGRDMGTVVFPDALVKFFLTASPEIRAGRRFLELRGSGRDSLMDDVQRDMDERDRRDTMREVSPLRPADDAILVDTSHLGIEEVLELLERRVRERTGR